MDGLYEAIVKTPIGEIKGNLKLECNGTNLSGYVEAMGKRSNFSGGKVVGNKFLISGTMSVAITKIQYDIQGEVIGNVLNISAKTNMGNFKIQGRKIK